MKYLAPYNTFQTRNPFSDTFFEALEEMAAVCYTVTELESVLTRVRLLVDDEVDDAEAGQQDWLPYLVASFVPIPATSFRWIYTLVRVFTGGFDVLDPGQPPTFIQALNMAEKLNTNLQSQGVILTGDPIATYTVLPIQVQRPVMAKLVGIDSSNEPQYWFDMNNTIIPTCIPQP